jgi:pimeloyl-ACP methyl ester carboxylesterase
MLPPAHRLASLPCLALLACASPATQAPAPSSASPLGDSATLSPPPHTGALDTGDPVPHGSEPAVTAPCTDGTALRQCDYDTHTLQAGAFRRDVHVALPLGTPPAEGWPVAVLFQGSFFSAELFWEARPADPFGAWYQTGTVGMLLGSGFAVVTPEALADGGTFWNTNVPPFNLAWETAPDHDLMLALFDAFADGTFGPLDDQRLYAGGISSGGYMSSRMALSYPGRFRALAIHSASWATCSGPLCLVPRSLPSDHPPTLFLHGDRDAVVPVSTMVDYADALVDDGVEVRVVRDADAGHEWIEAAPGEVAAWFVAHP